MMRTLVALAFVSVPYTATAGPPGPPPVPVDVKVTNPVLPVEVSNAEPILVTDPFAVGGTPTRFGPTSVVGYHRTQVVPDVPAGKTLVVTSLNIFVSASSSISLSSASCELWVAAPAEGGGKDSERVAAFPLALASGLNAWSDNLALSLPVKASESLEIVCIGTPEYPSQFAAVTVGGYFVPATS